MDQHVLDNAQLNNVHRALVAGDEEMTRDAVAAAAATPQHIPWLKRILRDIGRDLRPALAMLLQDAIAEWEGDSTGQGVRGGEVRPEEPRPPRAARTTGAREPEAG